jgi:hypothetical protein
MTGLAAALSPRIWWFGDPEPMEPNLRVAPGGPESSAGGPWRREADGLWNCWCGEGTCAAEPAAWPWVDLLAADEPLVEAESDSVARHGTEEGVMADQDIRLVAAYEHMTEQGWRPPPGMDRSGHVDHGVAGLALCAELAEPPLPPRRVD